MDNWLYQDKLDIRSIYKFGRFIFIQNSIKIVIPSKQHHTRLEIFYYWYFNEKLKLFKSSYKLFITKPRLMKIFPQPDIYNDSLARIIVFFLLFSLTRQFTISIDISTAFWSSCENFATTIYSFYSISFTSVKISSSKPPTYQRFYWTTSLLGTSGDQEH